MKRIAATALALACVLATPVWAALKPGDTAPVFTAQAALDEGDVSSAGPLLNAVRAALRQAVPAALIPAHLCRIDTIPLTPAGKRDDAVLLAMAGAHAETVTQT